MENRLRVKVVLLVFVIVVGVYCHKERESRMPLVVSEHLEEVIVTVDGEKLTLRDMVFYIAYQEKEVQEEAIIYSPNNPGRYWNAHTNGHFVRTLAEDAVIKMAVHDEIFFQMALEDGLALNEEETHYLENEVRDFCGDLKETQYERLGVNAEELEASMEKIALANKYQDLLAQTRETAYEAYNYTGACYEELMSSHEIIVNEAIWKRVTVGKITVNY